MESRATTVRFSDVMYRRLEHAGELTGLPINSLVVIACLEWLDAHNPPGGPLMSAPSMAGILPHFSGSPGPRRRPRGPYPFDRFTDEAKNVLTAAQAEAGSQDYITDQHLLIALALDPNSLAGRALAALGAEADGLRGAQAPDPARGTGLLGKLGGIPTSNTKRIIEAAFNLAKTEGAQRVGTSHLLIALVSEPGGTAVATLNRLGVTPDQVRADVQRARDASPQLG